jgi:hypothetical protein
MSHRCIPLVLCWLAAAGVSAAGDEVFKLKVRGAERGEVLSVEKDESQVVRNLVLDRFGQLVKDVTEKTSECYRYEETILETAVGGTPTKLRRRYDKAESRKGRRTDPLACNGMTVLIEMRDGRYRFRFDGGRAMRDDESADLDREFNVGDEKFRVGSLIPDKGAPVGKPWKIEMAPLLADLQRSKKYLVQADRARGDGELHMTTPLGGAQFALMTCKLQVPLLAMAFNPGEAPRPLADGAKATFDLSLDLCVDGSEPTATLVGKGKVHAKAAVPLGAAGVGELTLTLENETREVRKLVRDKK